MKTPSWLANLESTYQETAPILTWTEPKAVVKDREGAQVRIFSLMFMLIGIDVFPLITAHLYNSLHLHQQSHLPLPLLKAIILTIWISGLFSYALSLFLKERQKIIYLHEDSVIISNFNLPIKDIIFFNITQKKQFHEIQFYTIFGFTKSLTIPDSETLNQINAFLLKRGLKELSIDSLKKTRPPFQLKPFIEKTFPPILKWKEPKAFRGEFIQRLKNNRFLPKFRPIAMCYIFVSLLIIRQHKDIDGQTTIYSHPENLISDSCAAIIGSFLFAYGPFYLVYLPLQIYTIRENGIRSRNEYKFNTFTYYYWSNTVDYFRLHLFTMRGGSHILGVPDTTTKENINTILQKKEIKELVLTEI